MGGERAMRSPELLNRCSLRRPKDISRLFHAAASQQQTT